MSTSSTPIPTPISLETVTICTFGTAAAAAATETMTTSSVYWNATGYEWIDVGEVIVRTVDAFVDDCGSYLFCEVTAYPNPDISGRGVLTAFLVSAYLVLALILWAYWFGALPKGLVRRVDQRLFFARREQPDDGWRRIFVEIVLVFSDQQLLTALAILVAGYTQALGGNLSVYHWNNVIYLAWLSSTVHLMSLSVLRDRLKESQVLRAIRVITMILILGLLLAALVPTMTKAWQQQSPLHPVKTGMPGRCLWNTRLYGVNVIGDLWISYFSLLGAFTWKLCQFFDSSREWVCFWMRARLECFFEKITRRSLRTPTSRRTRVTFRAISTVYIIFVAWMELLECFMFTILLLAFTLGWGTYQLFASKSPLPEEIQLAEREMGFGQILPILLLSQPLFVAVQIYLG